MAKRSNPAMKMAQKSAHNAMFGPDGKPKPGIHNVLLRAVEVQRPLVLANLRRLQRRHPQATAAATVGFLEATALYTTSLAELHGIRMVDPDRASTLVMAIILGEEGTELLSALSGQASGRGKGPTQAWGSAFARNVPQAGVGSVRGWVQRAFLRNLLKRQGSFLLGRALPFGIGAVVGGVGNHVMGRAVIANTTEAFGPLPDTIPGELLAGDEALEGGNHGS